VGFAEPSAIVGVPLRDYDPRQIRRNRRIVAHGRGIVTHGLAAHSDYLALGSARNRAGAGRACPELIRSVRSSLNRRFGGILSTVFTRATSICGKAAVVALVVPIVADSCACAASDHAAATPPNRPMNLRRFIRSPRRQPLAGSAAR